MQALVLCVRVMAFTEECKYILSRYRRVWAVAWRVLLACVAFVLLYSGLAARRGLGFVLPKAERGLELAIAAVIVAVFVFMRYYGLKTNATHISLPPCSCLSYLFHVPPNTTSHHPHPQSH